MNEELPFCECGECGLRVTKPGDRFINGHQNRGKNNPMWKLKPEPQLCECGCGEFAKSKNKFIKGHNTRGKYYWASQQEPQLCECGCDEYALPGNKFILGHSMKGRDFTDEHRSNISKARQNHPVSDATRKKIIIGNKRTYKEHPELWDHSRNQSGDDLVWHHIAYDFGRPEALRVRITRKFHGQIHKPKGIPISKRGYLLID
jgi:hypothetical protein